MNHKKIIVIVSIAAVFILFNVWLFSGDDENLNEHEDNTVSTEQTEGSKTSKFKEKTEDTASSKNDIEAEPEKDPAENPEDNPAAISAENDPSDLDDDTQEENSENAPEGDEDSDGDGEESDDSYVFETTGNFTDIDPEVFAHAYLSSDTLVGRWYEDGFTNGYYLEFYGDGTWRYYGERIMGGTYTLYNNSNVIADASTGEDLASFFVYNDDGPKMSMGVYQPWNFVTRTKTASVYFRREAQSSYCENLEAFYEERYPYAYLAGEWYPVGDNPALIHYNISVDLIYTLIEVIDGREAGADAGQLVPIGDGIYEAINDSITVEESADGYLYINEEAFERR